MSDELAGSKQWAAEQFASAQFGDVRRSDRAKLMLRRAAERPGGRLTEVFQSPAELLAAYDFVEGGVPHDLLVAALADAGLRAVEGEDLFYVPIDGTSLSLTDRAKKKDFGVVGKRAFQTRGLKVIDAVAVRRDGAPMGLLALEWWARGPRATATRRQRRRSRATETQRWVAVIDRVGAAVRQAGDPARAWLVVDREGDASDILDAVGASRCRFTVRAAQDRCVRLPDGRHRVLRAHMKKQRSRGTHFVHVPAGANRMARTAALDVRYAEIVLDLPDYTTRARRRPFPVGVVWVRERRSPRRGAPLDWMLLTNARLDSYAAAVSVIESYCHRWRIEDFHRTWKRGHCNVEATQLRAQAHVLRWATMLAAVALRIERLKHLARTQPDEAATIELSALEIDALRAAKSRIKKRTEVLPRGTPSISLAVQWIAELGGYTGKSSGGPPGSTTIGRGLERLLVWADGYAAGARRQK